MPLVHDILIVYYVGEFCELWQFLIETIDTNILNIHSMFCWILIVARDVIDPMMHRIINIEYKYLKHHQIGTLLMY